jgi:hypothetical protein
MKRILSLITLAIMLATGTKAQGCFVFVDKDGQEIANETTIVRNEAAEDDFGMVQIPSELSVKNASAPEGYQVRIEWTISRIDNGAVQVCYPMNCVSQSNKGTYQSAVGQQADGTVQDLMSEWLPSETGAYGECIVTYKAVTLQPIGKIYTTADSRTVTVRYVYADPASIGHSRQASATPMAWYDLSGRKHNEPAKGFNIVRMSDGKVKKVFRQ